jgi:anaerobic selenocysteine-containing dehydrogenase
LRGWSDHALEKAGPPDPSDALRPASDRYVPCSWEEAFAGIGAALRKLPPKETVFYTSGRASLEAVVPVPALRAALRAQQPARQLQHVPRDDERRAEEGDRLPVGTCILSDFDHCDLILFFGQNTGTSSPRFLHPLKAAVDRGCRIVTFNPCARRGS